MKPLPFYKGYKGTFFSLRQLALAFLLAGLAAVNGYASQAAPNDDLYIGFETTGAIGTTVDYLLDVGQVGIYATDTSSIITLGTYGNDLNAIYGSSWYNNTGVLWGAAAATLSASDTYNGLTDSNDTLYATAPTTGTNTPGVAWNRSTKGGQAAGAAVIQGTMAADFWGGSYTNSYNAITLATNAVAESKSDSASWSATANPGSGPAFQAFNGSIEAGFTGTNANSAVLDLFRMAPATGAANGTPGSNVGYFVINDTGTIQFIPYAMTLGGGGAGSYTGPWLWTGASGNWSGTNNWQSNGVATNGLNVGITGTNGGVITNDTVSSLGSLTYSNGAGAYTLTGPNVTVSGGITNYSTNAETIAMGLTTTNAQAFNAVSGNLSLSGGILNTAILTMQEGGSRAITVGGVIGGGGSLIQSGSGTLVLSASNSYSGGTTLNGGSVVAGNNSAFGSGGITVASNSTIAAGIANLTTTNAVSIANGATTIFAAAGNTWTQGGAVNGGGSLANDGSGTLVLSASNSYSGGTTLNGGSVVAGNNSAFGSGGITVASNSTIAAGIANLTTTNAVSIANGATTTFDTAGNTWTQGGAINGAGGLNLVNSTGSGTLTLSASNSYTGGTIINSANLQVTGSLARTGTVTVGSGGVLSGTGSVGAVTVSSGGTLTPGANANTGSLTLQSVIWNGGGNLNLKMLDAAGTAGSGYDSLVITGNLNLSTLGSGNQFNINLWSLSGTNPSVNGQVLNFNANISTNWTIATVGGGITGFTTNDFAINTTATNGTGGFANALNGGAFGITTNSTGLILTYTTSFVSGSGGVWSGSSGNLSSVPGITNGSSLVFSGAGGSVTNNSVTTLSSLTISNTAGSYGVSGNALTIGAGGIANNSSNSQTISNAITLGSAEAFTAGAGSLTIAGNVTNAGNTLTVNGSNNTLLAGVVSGTGGIAKSGSGTLTLSGADTFSGGTTIAAGSILLCGGNNRLLTNGSVAINSGAILNLGTNNQELSALTGSGTVTGAGGTLTLVPTGASTFSGSLTGADALSVVGSGTTILSGSNSYTGGTTVSGGTLVASNAYALGASTNSLGVSGTLNLGSQTITQGAVTMAGGTLTNGTLSSSSVTLNGGTVAASLAGIAAVTQSSGTTILSGSNSYTGGTTVSGGTLILENAFALGSTNGSLTIAGGTLNLGGTSDEVGSLSLISGAIGNGTVTSATGFTLNGNVAISATLLGGSGTTTIGSGTASIGVLPTGSVAVRGGTLLSSASIIGAANNAPGSVTVSSNATWNNTGLLTVGGSGNGTLTVAAGGTVTASNLLIASGLGSKGTVTLGSTNGVATLSLGSGSITFGSGNGNLVFNQSGQETISNAISGKGTITSSGSGITTLTANNSGFTGTNYLSSGTVVLGANSQLGGFVDIANQSAEVALNTGAILTGTGTTAVVGTLLDNSGLAFTNSIRGSVALSTTGTLQKTYQGGASVAGFGAGIGAGASFKILAGTAAGSGNDTLQATLVNGALNFKGTFTNAAVMSITDPTLSAIKNTILWYNTSTGTWVNTVAGNGQGGAVANISTNSILSMLGANSKLWGAAGFSGSFNTFLIDDQSLNLSNGLTSLNALNSSLINSDLDKIMGAYGYDASTHTSWAVIDHNSIFSVDGSTPDMSDVSLSDAAATADLSVFNADNAQSIGAVPEPGTWALVLIGGLTLTLVGWRRSQS